MKCFRMLLAGLYLLTATGCSQMIQVPRDQAMRAGTLRDAHVRTRTGETYYFDRATAGPDSLAGFAIVEKTVFLEGGEIQDVEEQREVHLAYADIEDLAIKKRNWKRAGLWTLAAAGVAGALAVVSNQTSGSNDANASGGGKPGGPGN